MGIRERFLRVLDLLNDPAIALAINVLEALALDPANQKVEALATKFALVRSDRPRVPVFLDKLRDPYFLCSTGGRVSYASPALTRFLDCTLMDLRGDGWTEFVDGREEQRRILEQWLVAAQTHQGFSYTLRCRTGSGQIKYAFVRVTPCLHPNTGAVTGFYGTVHPQVIPAHLFKRRMEEDTA